MKTSDEIKKGLRNARHVQCMEIASDDENVGTNYGVLIGYVLRDSIYSYIQQLESDNESKQKRIDELESRLAQVERERDAAVNDLKLVRCCGTCANNEGGCTTECYIVSGILTGWKWRGVCQENTKEENR